MHRHTVRNLIEVLIFAKNIKRLRVVLYTDCVCFEPTELRALFGGDNTREIRKYNLFEEYSVEFVVTKSVYYELYLIKEYSKIERFRSNAELILSKCKKMDWNLEDFYSEYSGSNPSKDRVCLFVFSSCNGQSLKRKEFITKACKNTGHYVWTEARCYSIDTLKGTDYANPSALNLTLGNRLPAGYTIAEFEFEDKSLKVRKDCIKSSFNSGKEASISECTDDRFKYRLIKTYYRPVIGNGLEKLKLLRKFGKRFEKMDVAFPEAIMYAGNSRNVALGISMKKAVGSPLSDLTSEAYTDPEAYELNRADYDEYVVQILTTLLELHCFQIFVSDISDRNIMIDEEKRSICFVDSDSFQYANIPGGGCTPEYKHKEISLLRMHNTLRYPLHEDFSLAVLLYKMYILGTTYIDSNDMDRICIDWEKDVFQLEANGNCCNAVKGSAIEAIWKNVDNKVRTLFADEFHFRKCVSIGSWIEALGFLD